MDSKPPDVIIPPAPTGTEAPSLEGVTFGTIDTNPVVSTADERDAKILDLEARLRLADVATKELEAKLAGADQRAATYQLERDAARKALDEAHREPCRTCGTQRTDSP